MGARYYVGFRDGGSFVFTADSAPTRASHGHRCASVIGPFRTKRAAVLTAVTRPNPHILSVSDAERIAAKGE